jgi:Uma2 family endonuclease
MTATAQRRMTADEFIAWAVEQPEGRRCELVAGQVVAMAPERAAHSRMKGRIHMRLEAAISAANLPCEAFPDGMTVRVDASTVYKSDAMARYGPPINDDATEVADPLIVIEVVSPAFAQA